MTIADWPVSYDELEPFYDRFDKMCGASGQAGNLRGKKIDGGNVFEGARSEHYPNAPIKSSNAGLMYAAAAKEPRLSSVPGAGGDCKRGLTPIPKA